jgi:hypothetical protein
MGLDHTGSAATPPKGSTTPDLDPPTKQPPCSKANNKTRTKTPDKNAGAPPPSLEA